jgi:hypothetical protein
MPLSAADVAVGGCALSVEARRRQLWAIRWYAQACPHWCSVKRNGPVAPVPRSELEDQVLAEAEQLAQARLGPGHVAAAYQ